MFSYLSGFVSDIDLDQDADVYVYLLFPQRFSKFLNVELFRSFSEVNKRHGLKSFNTPTLDGNGSIHDHYIPFAFPFKARYCRDTGVYLLNDESETIKWLEEHFNVNMKEFLGELSNNFFSNKENVEITFDNIFDYLAVAFEHVSFVDDIKEKIKKDTFFMNGIKTYEDFYSRSTLTLTQKLMLGEDLILISKNTSKLELIMNIDEIEKSFDGKDNLLFPEAYYLSSLEYLMYQTNKIYKPCSKGNQRMDQTYTDILENAKKKTNSIVFKGYNEDE
jgi:hypothetical protein